MMENGFLFTFRLTLLQHDNTEKQWEPVVIKTRRFMDFVRVTIFHCNADMTLELARVTGMRYYIEDHDVID